MKESSSHMTNDRLKYLIDRYLNNTATEEELQEYADWYRQQGAEGDKLFDEIDSEQARAYTDSLYASIINNIHFVEHEQKQAARTRRMLFIKTAAAVLVAVSGLLILYNGLKTNPATSVAQNNVQELVRDHVVTIRNRTGISSPVYLHDGSVVQLFAGSELSYEEPFNTAHRKVYLSGKGFFKVAKDPTRPFTVYSHDIATTALGTSFTITAWPGKNDVLVVLHTGKVLVQHVANGALAQMKDVYLIPGQQVLCNVETGIATMHTDMPVKTNIMSPGSRTGFAVNFDEEPMVNVLGAIEKGYAVTLQYNKDELANMNFSGRVKATDSLSQVLKRISILYNLSIKASGNKFIIQKTH
jgi:ferric-dicitrate binding protein FerR (iron transport regulator)